jgi:hypothetical protein
MKTILVLALLFVSLVSNAQKFFVLNIVDRLGFRDSVIIGTDPTATRGIDFHLVELDIRGSSPRGTDIRSVMLTNMCRSDSANYWQNTRIYESKIDLRDSMIGLPVTFNGNPDQYDINEFSKHSFYVRIQCGAQPCMVFFSRQWPFVRRWADRFTVGVYNEDANGNMNCLNIGNGGYGYSSPDTIYNDSLPPFYINYIYYNPLTNSIPKSLAAAGLSIKEGYMVNENTVMAPAYLEIIDPVGRRVFNADWPEDNRMFLPQHLHGVMLLRVRYRDGQMLVVRHGVCLIFLSE